VEIRTYQPGDEAGQVAVYNQAAARFPKFKPATTVEVRRRCQARDFDPSTWFYVADGPEVVAYATFHPHNGRVSYPWFLPGFERVAEPLFQRVLEPMRSRKMTTAFTAYRSDWTAVHEFFLKRGFRPVREMVNFVLDIVEMPTPPARPSNTITPLQPEDIPALQAMAANVLRKRSAADLERYLFHNPYFSADALYVLRARTGSEPLAVGLFIEEPTYADPKQLDAQMPCFRLGAFGTEGMTTKRINGMFSFVTAEQKLTGSLALDLVGHAAFRLQKSDLGTIAAQVPADVPHLLNFYERNFKRQGSFPVLERDLTSS
jgi:hypothetical protein